MITSGASGTGNGTVSFSVSTNTGSSRTGTLRVAGQTLSVTQNAATCTYSINPTQQSFGSAGGSDYISGNGIHYLADRYFSGGVTGITGSAIKGTTDASLYQTARSGNFSYAIPLANGNYGLTLKFAETTYSSPGQRIFNVLVGETTVLKDFDIYDVSGRSAALGVTFTVSVTNGILNIQFVPTIGDAQINALLISTASSTPQNPPGRIRRYYTTEPVNSGNRAP